MNNDSLFYEQDNLSALNPQQRKAVQETDGQYLILAGAGTGKTKVLTQRLCYILQTQKAQPYQILAVTFTNKAAQEIRTRIRSSIDIPVESLWIGTFHALATRMIRRYPDLCGLEPSFIILDEKDQRSVIEKLLEQKPKNPKLSKFSTAQIFAVFHSWKNRNLSPQNLKEQDHPLFELYRDYQERLMALNACDFGDLLLYGVSLLQNHEDVLQDYHHRFHYILVDEYQDTNVVEYLWLRLLVQGHNNIFCVGDEDQSIYEWRGAQIDNILRFQKDFPQAKVIRLEQNYRSTGHVLAAASGMIAHNKKRLGKTLWTQMHRGEKVKVVYHLDSDNEARWVVQKIHALHQHSIHNIAILVRTHSQTRDFEDNFVNYGLPYRVVGALRFYERREIKDLLAYLRVIHSGDDDIAFERVLSLSGRGIGKVTVQKISNYAHHHDLSLYQSANILVYQEESLRSDLRQGLKDTLELLHQWKQKSHHLSLVNLTNLILEESGYKQKLRDENTLEADIRLENLKEMLNPLSRFTNLTEFLECVVLSMEQEHTQQTADNVTLLMTLHKAKGLEFDVVFLPGWEEELFPNSRSLEDQNRSGIEEERRLAYVGITRAKKMVYISCASRRGFFGQFTIRSCSRFIHELPAEHIEIENHLTFRKHSLLEKHPLSQKRPTRKPHHITNRKHKPKNFTLGMRVFHETFGEGTVRHIDQNKLMIAFDTSDDIKYVMDSFVTTVDHQ